MGKTAKKCPWNSKIVINLFFLAIALGLLGLAFIFTNKINIGLSPTTIQVMVVGIELFAMIIFLFKGNKL